MHASQKGNFHNRGRRLRLAAIALAASGVATTAGAGDHIFSGSFEERWKVARADILAAASDDAIWQPLRARCERDLGVVVRDVYAGFDWKEAAGDYAICHAAGTLRADAKAEIYGRKAIGLMKVLARSFPVIAANQNHQFLAFGDGTTRTFDLGTPPLDGSQVRVFRNTARVSPATYSTTPLDEVTPNFDASALQPVLRISQTQAGATANGTPDYVRGVDYRVSMRDVDDDGNSTFNVLHWNGSHHPSGTYYIATTQTTSDTQIAQAQVAVSGSTLTLATAPAAGDVVFVEYVHDDYAQTSNDYGAVESVKPDGPGYNMRAMNVGLAYAFDAMRQSPLLTPALQQAFYDVLNGQIDWYTAAGYEGPNLASNPIGNYYIRGYLTGVMFTAYATDGANPRATGGGDLKPLARSLLTATFQRMRDYLPGGYGPQGTYSEGTNQDMLQLFDMWKMLTATDGVPEDLAPQLEWTSSLVPATIHGTKPDRVTFYDGGDWNEVPATPLVGSMQAFVRYQPDHPMAPFARQLLADTGHPVAGPVQDYKSGASAFPLSYRAAVTGPVYARSDWSTAATWMSLAAGPIFEDHQHRDQGNLTIQRGADYLLIDAGGYDLSTSLPWHNTLGIDDSGQGGHVVYPPGQGYWGEDAKIKSYAERGTLAFAQADIADAYVNNDGETNSVLRAVRTLVFVRPGIAFVHDNVAVAASGVKRIVNWNFYTSQLARDGDVFTAQRGSSKLFMRSVEPANPVPATALLDYAGGNGNVTNYQLTATGSTQGTFVHVFETAPSSRSAMSQVAKVESADHRADGAQVRSGDREWVMLAANGATPIARTSALAYTLARACPCTHVVADLVPSTDYTVTPQGGGTAFTATSDGNGLLVFDIADATVTGVGVQ